MRFRNENQPLPGGPEPTIDYSTQPFQIHAVDGDVVFYMSVPTDANVIKQNYQNHWEISFNQISWISYEPNDPNDVSRKITIPDGKILYIRSTKTNYFGVGDTSNTTRWRMVFEGTGKIICKGQLSSMCFVDYLTPQQPTCIAKSGTSVSSSAQFMLWFNNNRIIDVSDLYINFNSISPTNGASYSIAYGYMFQSTAITKGPHYTTLCAVSGTAPCISTFYGCKSLEEVEIPMFKGTLPSRALESMFNGCTSLKKIIYRGTAAITSTYTNMYANVPSGGIFYNLGGANVTKIPSGWTIKTTLD